MAKKRRRRRRMNGCLRCLITITIINVILLGVIYGGATFAWNQYVRPQTDISLNDAISLVGGLYFYKDKNIVTNPYETKDVDGFYNNLAQTLYLDESINLRESLFEVLDGVVASLVDKKDNNENNANEENLSFAEEGTSITGNEYIDKFFSDLKFDFSRLKQYENENTTPQVLQLKDKEVAAFIDSTIETVLKNDYINEQIEGAINTKLDLSSVVRVPQVVIKVENDKGIPKTALTLTIKLNLRSVAKQYLNTMNLGFLSIAIPKSTYGTITIYPDDIQKEAKLMLNDYNDKRMNNLYKLLNLALKNSSYGSMNGLLEEINAKCVGIVDKLTSTCPVYFIESGSAVAKPITAMMKLLHIDNITETQFFCMIRDIFLPTFDEIAPNLGFENGTKHSEITALAQNATNAFIKELETKYAINEGYLSKDNMFDSLSTMGSDDSDLISNINIRNLSFENEEYVPTENKVSVGYLAFAGLINSRLSSDESFSSMSIDILNMTYNKNQNQLALVIEIGLLKTLNLENNAFSQIISQFIPEGMYISAIVDLDDSTGHLSINGMSIEQTKEHLNTIFAIAQALGVDVSSFNYDSLVDNISQSLTSGLSQIEEQLGCQIEFKENNVLLPSIYDVLSGSILKSNEEGAQNLNASEVYQVFRGVYVTPNEFIQTNRAQSLDSFVDDINDKYSISDSHLLSATAEEKLLTQITNLSTSYNEAIDGNKLKLKLSTWNNRAEVIQKEASILNDYSPMANEGELALLLYDAIEINMDGATSIELHQLNIVEGGKLQLIYNCNYSLDEDNKFKNFIPGFMINLILDLEKVNTEDECCEVTINKMEDTVFNNFVLMAERVGDTNGEGMSKFSTLSSDLDEKIKNSISDSLSKIKFTIIEDDPLTETIEAKVYISSIFDITYTNIMTTDEDKAVYKPYDMADTFAALYRGLESPKGQSDIINDRNATPTDFYDAQNGIAWNELWTQFTASLSARNIGAAILKEDGSGLNDLKTSLGVQEIELYQIAVISGTNSSAQKSALLNDFTRSVNVNSSVENKDIILATFRMAGFGFNSTILPQYLYFTAIVDLDDLEDDINSIVKVKLAYNDLSEKEAEILAKIGSDAASNVGSDALSLDKSVTEREIGKTLGSVNLFTVEVSPLVNVSVTIADAIKSNYGSVEHTLYPDDDSPNSKICGKYIITYSII